MLAFHGSQEVKDFYVARVQQHRVLDQVRQGYTYWREGRGCAVGCTLHSNDHTAYETELGIPWFLAVLQEHLFERMEKGAAKFFPEEFLLAIEPGADLSRVFPGFVLRLLEGALRAVVSTGVELEVVDLYRRWASDGEKPAEEAFKRVYEDCSGWNARLAFGLAARVGAYPHRNVVLGSVNDILTWIGPNEASHRTQLGQVLCQMLKDAPVVVNLPAEVPVLIEIGLDLAEVEVEA